jgi:predicted CoA-binding protein
MLNATQDWRELLVDDNAGIAGILDSTRSIAVLGMKTEQQAGEPAFEVPRYLAEHGFVVIPVPVYFPDVAKILGRPVYRSVAAIPEPVDLVNVFRRSRDVEAHVDDIIAAKPRFVWLQSGIVNDAAAERFAREGIRVVQNRCLMVEHARWWRRRR